MESVLELLDYAKIGEKMRMKGMKAEDAIERMEGTTCGPRPTSCPDQIAKNLKKALAEL